MGRGTPWGNAMETGKQMGCLKGKKWASTGLLLSQRAAMSVKECRECAKVEWGWSLRTGEGGADEKGQQKHQDRSWMNTAEVGERHRGWCKECGWFRGSEE
jgi:hypothetical protein